MNIEKSEFLCRLPLTDWCNQTQSENDNKANCFLTVSVSVNRQNKKIKKSFDFFENVGESRCWCETDNNSVKAGLNIWSSGYFCFTDIIMGSDSPWHWQWSKEFDLNNLTLNVRGAADRGDDTEAQWWGSYLSYYMSVLRLKWIMNRWRWWQQNENSSIWKFLTATPAKPVISQSVWTFSKMLTV